MKRKSEILSALGDKGQSKKVMLFYEFIGEGQIDFVDTYDASKGAQDQKSFAACFDELETTATRTIEHIQQGQDYLVE